MTVPPHPKPDDSINTIVERILYYQGTGLYTKAQAAAMIAAAQSPEARRLMREAGL